VVSGIQRRVANNGLITFFVKYRKRHRLPDETASASDCASLVCLHHYDQVILHPNISTVSQIEDITGSTPQDVVASKWMLTFRLEGDASPGFDICAW
jgi:hypothetical protein